MKLKDFQYPLPQNLIAQEPLRRRDRARLMVIDRNKKTIRHDTFKNIRKYLPARSCLVVNDSKVVPARLLGKREHSGGEVEIFLLKRLSDGYSYEALLRPLRRLKLNEKIVFNGGDLIATIKDKDRRIVRLNRKNVGGHLERIGHIPLPPYIKRADRLSDRKDYQTVYARKSGSVAAPTAGLHFTRELLNRLKKDGHSIEKVTLHINYATFKPVEEADITNHRMHCEDFEVRPQALKNLVGAKKKGHKIVAVGTTSCRVLETIAARNNGGLNGRPFKGSTDMFIYPGFKFRMTDILVTNFHLPASTLLILVYAFGGRTLMKNAYRQAVKERYRFYSYGDAMMII